MIQSNPNVVKALALTVRTYPEILTWLEEWRMSELERLPQAITNPALFQGRCQVLSEVADFVKNAPAYAAKL